MNSILKKSSLFKGIILLFSILTCTEVISQTVLPTSRTTWNTTPGGWTDNGTGSYTSSFACSGNNGGQLDDAGDFYTIFFSDAPDQLSFELKGASFSGGTFLVEESVDGSTWSTLSTFTSISGSCNSHSYTLDCATRYVRFNYVSKSGGNISIDDVNITKGTPCISCSSCSIDDGGLTGLSCNNNSTIGDDTDDYLAFSLNPTGCTAYLSGTYSVSVSSGSISPTTASYGSSTGFTLNSGSAGGGNVTLTITDASGGSCSLDVLLNDPGTCSTTTTVSIPGGLIVNEFSNGPSGSKEFMEFLVVGTPCSTVDLRGWIFDDNNGLDDATCEGFSTSYTGAGIAAGHARFKYISRWSAVPVGSLILIYNDADKNAKITMANDPSDSNNDLLYVLPISDSGLEGTGDLPRSSGPADCGYSPSTYSSPMTWSAVSLNNSTDACQTRQPDGSYFHGFSYGSSASVMTGGPNNLIFNTSGTGKNFYLNCGHQSFINDYSTGTAGTSDETPGADNNTLNLSLIDFYRGTFGCGVQPPCVTFPLSSNDIYLKGESKSSKNILNLRVYDYSNILEYNILRSNDNKIFEELFYVKNNHSNYYKFEDTNPYNKTYYKIKVILKSGDYYFSNLIILENKNLSNTFSIGNIYPNPAKNHFSFNFNLNQRGNRVSLKIYSSIGKLVEQKELVSSQEVIINSSDYSNGIYTVILSNEFEQQAHKLIIQK